MQTFDSTRRDFLISVAGTGLVAIAQLSAPNLFAEQTQTVNGFSNLRAYGVKLYEETDAHNDAEHIRVRGTNQNPDLRFPYLFDGEMSGRKVTVSIPPKLLSDPYSLEAKVYFSSDDIPFSGEWADLVKNFPAKVFLDYGFKGNLRRLRDIITNLSVDSGTMEYALFMGNGGYYFAHFSAPKYLESSPESKINEYFRERMQNTFRELSRAGLSEQESKKLLSILTSFDELPQSFDHSFNFVPSFLDGAAWYLPSGVMQSYLDLSLNNNRATRVNVGTQPRLIGSYSKTSHAELRKKREQAFDSGNQENNQIIKNTIDNLVAERKISLQ